MSIVGGKEYVGMKLNSLAHFWFYDEWLSFKEFTRMLHVYDTNTLYIHVYNTIGWTLKLVSLDAPRRIPQRATDKRWYRAR